MYYETKFRILIAISFIAFANVIFAQSDLAYYQKEYPTREYIYLERNITVNLFIENDKLIVEKTTGEKRLLLTEQAKLLEKESIPFASHNKIESITAKSKVPNGKKYKTYNVKDFETQKTISDNYFFDDSSVTSFTYPNVQEGTICDLEYTQRTDLPIFVPRIFLGFYAPVEVYNIKVIIDEGIDIDIREYNNHENISYVKESKNGKDIYSYSLKNITPLKYEDSGPSYESIAPHIIINVNHFKTASGEQKAVMGSLQDLYNNYTEFINHVDTTVNKEFRLMVDSITNSTKDELKKVKSVYNWVRKNIKYIAFEDNMGGFIPRDPQLVFDRRFGDCKDMSSLTIKMLNVAGINAHYAWVGTRDIPYKYTEDFGTFVDNHMIAMYYSDKEKKYYHLDATNEFLPFGIPPPHIQEKQVLVYLNDKDYDVQMTNKVNCFENENSEKGDFKIVDTNLIGDISVDLAGHEYYFFQSRFGHSNEEELDKRGQSYFSRGNNKSEVKDLKLETTDNKVNASFSINIKDYVSVVGDQIMINMNLEQSLVSRKIKKNRKNPIKLTKTLSLSNDYSIEIPDGYQVDYIPENFSFNSNDDFSADISYTQSENKINYHFSACVNTLWIKNEQFEDWSKLLKKLQSNYKENVILSKK